MKILISFIIAFIFAFSSESVYPLSKDYFVVVDKSGNERFLDMRGKDYIVVSLREEGADGRFYAVDRDGCVWMNGVISSGAVGHRTPTGVFSVKRKARFHMSTKYPDVISGRNNMDYSLFFTWQGHALHLGNINSMSHGCVHVYYGKIEGLFKWGQIGMPVIVTRNRYLPHVIYEL